MNLEDLKDPSINGIVSTIISLVITYGYHLFVHSSDDIQWAMVAVGIAAFLSAFFSTYDYNKK